MSADSAPIKQFNYDLIGVGAPIMDLVASVPESFLAHAKGEKGGMAMVDAKEMERLVSLLPTPPKTTPGGSAANTTFNATRLGLSTAFVGKLGSDDLAAKYLQRFSGAGVDPSRFKQSALPNARSLILTTPDAQRTMRTCLGAVMTLSPDEISPADFEGALVVHIEGYVLFNQALAAKIISSARAAGCEISLSFASFEVVAATRDWLLDQLKQGLSLVFANEDEARTMFPELPAKTADDYAEHAKKFAAFGGLAAITLGKEGAWIAHGSELHRVAPCAVADVIDTNGAGDAWAAGFLSAWLRDQPLPVCGKVASLLGAQTVRHMGPVIPDDAWPAVAEKAKSLLV
ncbi:MAG: adenosine kinase [Verrucomicrobia bacterium]|nr:adenosine kinase [Verrucomicrobiota bacterium]